MERLLSRWRKITAPRATDDDQAHREYLTKVILIMMGGTLTVFTLLLIAGWAGGLFDFLSIAPILVIDVAVFGGVRLVRSGHWQPASYLPPAITFGLAAYLTFISGLQTSGQLFYLLTIMLTALLIGIRAQWIAVGLSTITYLAISLRIESFTLEISLPIIVMLGAALTGTALLQWLSTDQLKRWLAQSQLLASELSKSSAELADVNQELRREVSDRLQAEAALQQFADRLKALHQVDQSVLAAQSMMEIAQAVLNRIRLLVACQRTSIALFDMIAGRVSILAVDVDGNTNLSSSIQISLNDFGGIPEMMLGQHRLINDLRYCTNKTTVENRLIDEGIRTVLNVPLLSHGRLIGSINLGAVEPNAFQQEHVEIASELAGSLAVALQNTRLFQETREQARMLSSLNKITLNTSSVLDKDELIKRLYEQVCQILAFDSFLAALYEADTHEYRIEYAVEEGVLLDEWAGRQLSIEEGGLTGWVLMQRQPLLVNDLEQEPLPTEPKHGSRQARSWLGVPMITRDRIIGVLSVQSFQPYAFTEIQLHFMEALAGQVAVGLENARLFAETRQRADELQALADISLTLRSALTLDQMLPGLLGKTASLLWAEFGNVYLIERETGDLVAQGWYPSNPNLIGLRLHRGEGITGHVAASGEMHIAEDFTDDPWLVVLPEEDQVNQIRCGISLPLRTDQKTVGVINFGSSSNQIISPNKLQLAKAIAEMAANAIWRATLFEETQQRFEHLLALRMIDRAITSSPELSLLLDILLDQVILQLHVDAATVLLFSAPTCTLDFASQRGFRTTALQRTHLSLGEGHAGRAAQEQRIIQISDLDQHYGDFSRAMLLNNEGFQAYFAVPLIAKGQVKGVLEIFHRSHLNPDREWFGFLDAIATQAAIAIDNARLFENLQTANVDLVKAYDATIEGWSRALDLRDKETEGHSQRVAEMTVRLAREMGMKDEELVHIQRGSLLHDIGKMGIPDSILLKPAALTDDEWKIMCQHPLYAYQLLYPIAHLRPALDIPYCHHEKWDGSGYPRGLKGGQIPLAARIFAVVDVWDALSSERPYREAWEKEKILDYIADQSGSHFDPRVVEVFFRLLGKSPFPEFINATRQQTSILYQGEKTAIRIKNN